MTGFFGKNLITLDETDSTNNYVKKIAMEGAPEGTLVIAKRQTAGRGRLGRKWVSQDESGIWMSFLLRPDIKPENASMITLICALALQKAIDEVCELETDIKWPNDIVFNGKKISGILTEMSADTLQINYVVAGVGINVEPKEYDEEINKIATSIKKETGKEVDRDLLIGRFGDIFAGYYREFQRNQNLLFMRDEYNRHLVNVNNKVKITDGDSAYVATAIGIDEQGELMVKDENGMLKKVRCGEVSVRGIYGYV